VDIVTGLRGSGCGNQESEEHDVSASPKVLFPAFGRS